MRTEVRFHSTVLPSMVVWRESLGRTEAERADGYPVHLDAMRDRLHECCGPPPEAVREDFNSRPVWWWRLSSKVRVKLVIGEDPPRPRGWWDWRRMLARLRRPPVRVVTVMEFRVDGSSNAGLPRS